MRATSRSYSHSAVRATTIAIAATISLIACHQKYRFSESITDYLIFGAQILSGNWSPEVKGIHWIFYTPGAIIAVILNVGTLSGVAYAVYNFYVMKRSDNMDKMAVFELRSADQKDRLIELLDDETYKRVEALIDMAFDEGDHIWREKTLPKVLGIQGARRFLDSVDKITPNRPTSVSGSSNSSTESSSELKPKM